MDAIINKPEVDIVASKKAQYDIEYAKNNLKRVPVNFQRDEFENEIYPAILKSGLPVGTFIKIAVSEKIERDNLS